MPERDVKSLLAEGNTPRRPRRRMPISRGIPTMRRSRPWARKRCCAPTCRHGQGKLKAQDFSGAAAGACRGWPRSASTMRTHALW
ncbi:hypothetical protein ACTMU2_32385 [Cupriavidus basilensis]